jgi:hypothetical protein
MNYDADASTCMSIRDVDCLDLLAGFGPNPDITFSYPQLHHFCTLSLFAVVPPTRVSYQSIAHLGRFWWLSCLVEIVVVVNGVFTFHFSVEDRVYG